MKPQSLLRLAPALALLLFASLAQAQVVGKVGKVSGIVVARSAEGRTRVLADNSPLRQGDTVSTSRDSFGRLEFVDGASMLLQPETVLALTRYSYDPAQPKLDQVELGLAQGGFSSKTGALAARSQNATVIKTPQGDLQGSASMEVTLRLP